ncbi:hypothetical protein L208DRAFT_1375804 [Tricholoma matsutake]|nr:hypothetical protein L208DRAFT_1375804 [Tricholoma matsutake 945]
MGVPGLWKILLPAAQRHSLTEVVAVEGFEQDRCMMQTMILGSDASIWMKKAQAKFYHPQHAQAGENPELKMAMLSPFSLKNQAGHLINVGLPGCGATTTFKLSHTGLGNALLCAAQQLSPLALSGFLTSWCGQLWDELSTNKSGFLGRHFSILAYTVHDDFPNINIIYQYARPTMLWSNGQNGPDISHLSELAALCECAFSWGSLAVTSIFHNNVWEGCCVWCLAQITEEGVYTPHPSAAHLHYHHSFRFRSLDVATQSRLTQPHSVLLMTHGDVQKMLVLILAQILECALPMLVQQFKCQVPPILPSTLSSMDTSKPVPEVHYEESPHKYSIPAEQDVINLTVGVKHLENCVELSGDSDFIDLTLSD